MNKLIGLLALIFIANSCQLFASVTPCSVGELGPGGGYIFFCDNLEKKVLPEGKIGLEAAPSDQEKLPPWSNSSSYKGGYSATSAIATDVGQGRENTRIIIRNEGSGKDNSKISAAMSCYIRNDFKRNKDIHSYWFLPSIEELDLMYKNLKLQNKGSFATLPHDFYWSSSEWQWISSSTDFAWAEDFNTGNKEYYPKATGYNVRCVRAF